jgi:hypothetical protein
MAKPEYYTQAQAEASTGNMLLSMSLLVALWCLSSCRTTAALPAPKPFADPEPEQPALVATERKEVATC